MTLQDIYDQLSYGELRLLFLGQDPDNPDAGMPESQFMQMLPTVQLGLTALHKRFALREGRVVLPLVADQASYVLKSKGDLANTFGDDILDVDRVYGVYQEEKYEIPLNEINNTASIRTATATTLLVPTGDKEAPWLKETSELEVVYRQDHPTIRKYLANVSPLTVKVDLPITHLEPLLLFIASRIYNPVGMMNDFHEGNNYAQKYELACVQLEQWGYQNDMAVDIDPISRGGWA